jgi:drug/metabolite transporter (DMT)-like permease
MQKIPSRPKAALWMSGWLALLLVMAIAGRESTRELNVFQLMEMRSVLGFLLLYPLIHLNGGLAIVKTMRLMQHVARNLVHYGAQLCWFFALTLIPIGQVVAIEFTMPIWTAILAAAFLGERMTVWKIMAIVLGLIGVLVIVRPTTGEINPGQLIALAAAVGFGISIALMKFLTRTDNTFAIVFWMLVVQSVAGFVPTLYVWVWPSTYTWGWIVMIAICGTFSHFCMARAMLYADATIVVPMDFLRVPLTATAGWADLWRAARCSDGARGCADPDRQSAQSAPRRAATCARKSLIRVAMRRLSVTPQRASDLPVSPFFGGAAQQFFV